MNKFYYLTLLFLSFAFHASGQYITVWKTDMPGETATTRITIPATGTNYSIAWQEEGNSSNSGTTTGSGIYTLIFPSPGTYQVSITPGDNGTFERVNFNNRPDRNKLIEVRQWGNIQWSSMQEAYTGCQNLNITATDTPNLQNVTSMSGMFDGCAALSTVPGIDGWDVSNVTNMNRLFHSAAKFNQAIGSWNVSKVTNMNSMFYQARAFNQPIGAWNVTNVTDMNAAFCLATAFNQPLNDWNVAQVTNMSSMFYGASVFNQPLNHWDVKNVRNMSSMFAAASGFNQSLGQWRIYSVTTMATMLASSAMDCASMTQTLQGWAANPATPDNITFGATGRNYGSQAVAAKELLQTTKNWTVSIGVAITCAATAAPYITIWNTENNGVSNNNQIIIPATGTNYSIAWEEVSNTANKGTAIGSGSHTLTFPSPGIYQVIITPGSGTFTRIAFANANDKEKILEVKQWGNIQWENMESAYQECLNLQITATDIPDLQDVTSMTGMFDGCVSLAGVPEMNRWNVSTVTNMQSTFAYAALFNEPIGNWNVSNVTNMSAMFQGAETFNQPLRSWNVGEVTNMFLMFEAAKAFNQPIGSWDVKNVTDMYGMFNRTENFDQTLNNWNVGQVTGMARMFSDAKMFNGDISAWNVGSVTTMESMFSAANAFNQPIGSWDVKNVTDMSFMFNGAVGFDQDIDRWDVGQVRNMSFMFGSATVFNKPIDSWDVRNVTDMSFMFSDASAFNHPINSWDVDQVSKMIYMFFGASSFNQPINDWKVSRVTDMSYMFYTAYSFNQSLSNWALTAVTDMSGMLSYSGLDCANMAKTLQGWAANTESPDGISFDAENVTYGSPAATALETLRITKNWTIRIGAGVLCAALEVSLISFGAKSENGSVKLEWATASETDNDYFETERSADARSWTVIGRIKGAGTVNFKSDYSQIDPDPLEGTSYYRLKIVDFAGKVDYSTIRAVNTNRRFAYNTYPNPAITSVTLAGKSKGHLVIFNLSGQQVMQTGIQGEKTVIPVVGLPAGTYVIKTDDGWNSKFVKN